MIFRISNVSRSVVVAVAFVAAAASCAAQSSNWQSLVANNPFGGAPAAAVAPVNGLEFRGVIQEDGAYLVNLYDPTTKTAQWLPVNGSAPGLTVNSYNEQEGKLSVTQGGKPVELSIKQPSVALLSAPVPVPGVNIANPQPGGPQGPGRPTQGGPQFNRTLPPETQAMIEEIRRRRAQRQQAIQQGGAGTAPQQGTDARNAVQFRDGARNARPTSK